MGRKETILSPMRGQVKLLSESKDEVFAQGLSGDGVLIRPESSQIVAPFDGQVVLVFDSAHAIILRSNHGVAMVIHVGVDELKSNENGFRVYVENGQKFHKGDLLMEMDFNYLKQVKYDMDTHILFPSLGTRSLKKTESNTISFLETLCEIK